MMFYSVRWPRSPWSIFDDLESLREGMNRAFGERDYGRPLRRERPTYPLLNIWSSADGLVIDAEMPGVDPKDVEVSVLGDELTLRGRITASELRAGETYHRRERPSGEFVRTLQLPFRADSGGVKARYENGVLRLTVPRSEEEKPKKITVVAS